MIERYSIKRLYCISKVVPRRNSPLEAAAFRGFYLFKIKKGEKEMGEINFKTRSELQQLKEELENPEEGLEETMYEKYFSSYHTVKSPKTPDKPWANSHFPDYIYTV